MRPMLDDLELPRVQEVNTYDRRVLADHKPPGMDGSVVQNLGRRPTRIVLWGVAAEDDSRQFIEKLEGKFRAGEPVPFTADIVADAEIQKVLVDDLRLQELAGKPGRFAYVLTLREFQQPKEPEDTAFVDTSLLDEATDFMDSLVEGLDVALQFASGLERFVGVLQSFDRQLSAPQN